MSWSPPPPPGPPNPPGPPPQGPPPWEHGGYPSPWPAPPPPPRNNTRRNVFLTIIAIVIIAAGSIIGWRLSSNDTSSGTALPPPGGHRTQHHTVVPSTSPRTPSTPPSSPSTPTSPSGSPTQASCDASASEQHDVLAAQLSAVIQHHDRTGFLALATDSATRSKMAMWWDNVNALGFTFGGADAADAVTTGSDRHVDVGIGLHNPLDGTTTNVGGTSVPNSPATWYRLTTAPGHGCLQRIAGWQSLSNAPWDEPYRLKVVKTTHAVVAGPSSIAATIRRVARLAEKAALWDFSFFRKNNGQRYLDHLGQRGFVVFVPGTNAAASAWFRGYHRQSPRGWTADPMRFAGLTFPLASPQYPMRNTLPNTPGGPPKYKDDYVPAGGARVIIDHTATSESGRNLEGTLVHEFVHDLLSTYNSGFYFGGKGVDAAVTEGAARLLETYFYDSPDCYCKHHGQLPRAFPTMKLELRKHFGLFHGHYPTDAQIYGGNGKLANYYYDLAASTFDYEIYSGGVPFGLQSIVDAYINGGGPFDGVFLRYRGQTAIFANPKTEQRKWAKWLRSQMR